jgi:hypothetical protein
MKRSGLIFALAVWLAVLAGACRSKAPIDASKFSAEVLEGVLHSSEAGVRQSPVEIGGEVAWVAGHRLLVGLDGHYRIEVQGLTIPLDARLVPVAPLKLLRFVEALASQDLRGAVPHDRREQIPHRRIVVREDHAAAPLPQIIDLRATQD